MPVDGGGGAEVLGAEVAEDLEAERGREVDEEVGAGGRAESVDVLAGELMRQPVKVRRAQVRLESRQT